jgi:hypothetical protein
MEHVKRIAFFGLEVLGMVADGQGVPWSRHFSLPQFADGKYERLLHDVINRAGEGGPLPRTERAFACRRL